MLCCHSRSNLIYLYVFFDATMTVYKPNNYVYYLNIEQHRSPGTIMYITYIAQHRDPGRRFATLDVERSINKTIRFFSFSGPKDSIPFHLTFILRSLLHKEESSCNKTFMK